MVWKIVLAVFATVFVLLIATSIWSYVSRAGAGVAMDIVGFKLLVLRSPYYWAMVLVIVVVAARLLRRCLTAPGQ